MNCDFTLEWEPASTLLLFIGRIFGGRHAQQNKPAICVLNDIQCLGPMLHFVGSCCHRACGTECLILESCLHCIMTDSRKKTLRMMALWIGSDPTPLDKNHRINLHKENRPFKLKSLTIYNKCITCNNSHGRTVRKKRRVLQQLYCIF